MTNREYLNNKKEALIKLYDEELERLIMIYEEANESNYLRYDIGFEG